MDNFKYKCKKCGSINSVPAIEFSIKSERKISTCKNCGNKVQLNAEKIRQELYNNFSSSTELVIGKKASIDDLYLKININDGELKKLMKFEKETLIIGRGKEVNSEIITSENGEKIQKITIPDKYISSKHCELKFNLKNKKTSIRDLSSLNKTFIDETELPSDEIRYINIHNKIRIGTTEIEIC